MCSLDPRFARRSISRPLFVELRDDHPDQRAGGFADTDFARIDTPCACTASGSWAIAFCTRFCTSNVGNVTVMGAGQYSMRIWMDPQKLYSFGLVPQDVINAVQQQSQEVTAGQVGMPPAPRDQQFQYTIDILSRFNDPGQFADIVIKDQTAQ